MADFTISGGLDPRELLEGLKRFEQQAVQSGQRAGDSLAKGFGAQVGSAIPSSLSKAIKGAEGSGSSSGAALGRGLVGGFANQVSAAIPSSLAKALNSATSGAGSAGKQLGASLAGGVNTSVGTALPALINKALGTSTQTASQSGRQLGAALASAAGGGIRSLLPPEFLNAVKAAGSQAQGQGLGIGSGLGSAIGTGVTSTLPASFKRVFTQAETQAGQSGRTAGAVMGQSLGQGIDAQKALFASVVAQAQKAARDVGLVFNSVKVRFEYPNGGLIPEGELSRLRALSPALNAAATSLSQFTGAGRQGAAGLEPLGLGMTNVTRQGGLMQAAVSGLAFSLANTFTNAAFGTVNAINGLVNGYAQLDTEIRKAATAAGEQGGYDRLTKSIDAVGIEAAGTQMEVAQLATSLVRAGYSIREVEAAMPGIVRGAEATGTGFEQMGSIVGNTLRGFGLEVNQTSRVVDVLVKTANASNASVEGLGYTFQYAAPVAKSLRINLEDLAATAGLMANAGIDASVAGTGLRFGLQRLQKAASGASGESLGLSKAQDKLTKALRVLGAEVTTAKGTLKPLDQVFLSLKRNLEKLDVSAQIELASAIFGDEAGSKFLSVTNQSEQAISKMFAEIRNAKGEADKARSGMQGFELAMKQLDGTIGVLTNTFGKVIATALTPFISAANVVLGAVVALPGPLKNLAAGLTLLVGAYVGAKVAAVAFKRSLEQPMVAAALKEVQVLTAFLRQSFKRDVAAAISSWGQFRAVLNTGSSNAAAAGLAQIAQGLKTLNAAAVANGFRQLGQTITSSSKAGAASLAQLAGGAITSLRSSLGNTALQASLLGLGLRDMATRSAAAESGLKGTALALQRSMTAGANAAAGSVASLSRVLGTLAGLSGGQLASGLAAAATAMAPLAIATAAIVPAVISYNQVMSQSRGVTAALGPVVDQFGQDLKSTGLAFEDFGRQGGPVAELTRGIGNNFKDLQAKLKDIPLVGQLAAGAFNTLWVVLKNSPVGLVVQGLTLLIEKTKQLYAEAGKNQAIIEASDQYDQFAEQADKAGQRAEAFRAKLAGLAQVSVGQLPALTSELERNRQALNFTITASGNLSAKYKDLAVAAQANNQPELVAHYTNLSQATAAQVKIATAQLQKLDEEANRRGLVISKLQQQGETASSLTQKLIQLNDAAGRASGDLQLMNVALSYGKAVADLEQSRFSIVKARGQYELQQAQERGAGEAQLNRIRQANRVVEAQALQARAIALVQQQQIEQRILEITQAKARIEANQQVIQAKNDLLDAQSKLTAAIASKDQQAITAAAQQLQLKKQSVGLAQDNVNLLTQIQPLERAVAAATNETAINSLKAEAAGQGFYGALQRSSAQAGALQQGMGAVQLVTRRAADGSIVISQQTVEAAAQAGALSRALMTVAGSTVGATQGMAATALETRRAADGTVVIAQRVVQSAAATQTAAAAANQLAVNFGSAVSGANSTASASSAVDQALRSTAAYAQQTSQGLGGAATGAAALGTNSRAAASGLDQSALAASGTAQALNQANSQAALAARNVDGVRQGLGAAQTAAGNVNQQLVATGQQAGEAAKQTDNIGKNADPNKIKPITNELKLSSTYAGAIATARMAENLSKASGSAGGLRQAMASAANSAQAFYEWLAKASGLPGSRWTGGPVDSGSQYRINELGQEAFLSAGGRLSLISRPANSLWTAPSAGVVIPAGVTEGLKQRGVFAPGGQARGAISGQRLAMAQGRSDRDHSAILARQAIAIGKLQQSVDALAAKDWNVQVRVRNDAGGATHLNTLNRMR